MKDTVGREIDYMRISVTDRCNLRCRYCMPEGIDCVPMEQILTYEEICSVAEAAAELGISKIRVTGGEPLVRKGCHNLVRMIKAIPGIEKVTLTTNGVLLGEQAESLIEAGIDGINVSLDTLDREQFARITGYDLSGKVTDAVFKAVQMGVKVKLNVVSLDFSKVQAADDVRKAGESTLKSIPQDWMDLIALTKNNAIDVRFIEIMPIGHGRNFPAVGHDQLLAALKDFYPGLERAESVHGAGPAVYYHIPGHMGDIGLISAMHGKFCAGCNRIRLTAKGYLKPCLCYENGIDLRPILRAKLSEKDKRQVLRDHICSTILEKPKEHCFEEPESITEHEDMVSIGG